MNENKQKIAIGFDLGTTSVGWSIIKINSEKITNENLEIIDMGVRLFNDPASSDNNTEKRRLARGRRRRINRQKIRKNDLWRLLDKYGILTSKDDFNEIITKSIFDPVDRKWLMPLDIKIKGLDNQLSKDEIILILHNYIKHRGTLNTIDNDNDEDQKEMKYLENWYDKTKLPCENQFVWFNQTGKVLGNKANSIIKNSEYVKEIRIILEKQNEIKDKKFIDEFIELFSRHRHYSEGPGSENSPTPYGLWRLNESTKEVTKIGDNLWDVLIGKCSYYKDEKRNYKKSPITEYFNLLNDFANIKVKFENNEIRYLTLDEKKKILKNIKYNTLTLDKMLKVLNIDKKDISSGLRKDSKDKFVIEELKSIKTISKWIIENKIRDEIDFLNIEDIKYLHFIFEIGVVKQNVNERIENFKCSKEIINTNNLSDESIENLSNEKIWSSGTAGLSSKAQLEFINYSLTDVSSIGKNQMNYFQESREFRGNNSEYENLKYLPNTAFKVEAMPLTVKRTFNQAIKVLNEILQNKKYSEYEISHIFIELAREMNSVDEAAKIDKELKNNQNQFEKLLEFHNITKDDLNGKNKRIKFLLFCQQNKIDLYDGKEIDLKDLLNNDTKYHIDHILPISISLNDSLNNKVLTKAVNNEDKGDLTPYQWLSIKGKYNEYRDRCLRLLNEIPENDKKTRSKMKNKIDNYLLYEKDPKEELQGFVSRQLNDSRYISVLFSNFLKDFFKNSKYWKDKKVVISPINGAMTTFARKNWFNEDAFYEQGEDRLLIKNRDIYSHHAIDASIIAFLGLNTKIQRLLELKSKSIKKAKNGDKDCWIDIETGEIKYELSDFVKEDAKDSIYFTKQLRSFVEKRDEDKKSDEENKKFIRYSRMVEKKTNLALSNETLYSLVNYNDKDYKVTKLKNILALTNAELKYYFLSEEDVDESEIKEITKKRNKLLIYLEDKKAFDLLSKIFKENYGGKKEDTLNAFNKYLNSDIVKTLLKNYNIEKLDKVPLFDVDSKKIFKWVRSLRVLENEIKDREDILTIKSHNNNAFYDSLKPISIRLYRDISGKYIPIFINALNTKWNSDKKCLIVDEEAINNELNKLNISNHKYLDITKGKTLILKNELYFFNGGDRKSKKIEIKILSMKNELAITHSNWREAPNRKQWQISISTIVEKFKLCKVDALGNVYEIFTFDEYFENNMLKY